MPKNTIDERLKGEYVVQFGHLFWSKEDTVELRTEAFKQALYQDLLELVGEDEPTEPNGTASSPEEVRQIGILRQIAKGRNATKAEIRQNINQYFKRGEG